jgi:hypothetical protein
MATAMLRIGLILVGCAAALVYGLMHSPRTRRLAIAALIIVGALILLLGLWAFIVKTWFPGTPWGALTPHPSPPLPTGRCTFAPGTIVSRTVEALSLRSRELREGAGVRVTPRPACGSARVGQPVGGPGWIRPRYLRRSDRVIGAGSTMAPSRQHFSLEGTNGPSAAFSMRERRV